MQRSVRTRALGLLVLLVFLSGSLHAQFTGPGSAAVGVPYTYDTARALGLDSFTQLLSSLGTQDGFSFTFSFNSSGNVPPGLTVSPNGLVSGTPTTAGQYDFTINFHFAYTISLPPGTPSIPGFNPSQSFDFPFPITIVVSGVTGPKLSVGPGGLGFPFTAGADPATQYISVGNKGDQPVSFSATVSVSSGGDWLSVSGGGAVPPLGQGSATVTASPGQLPAGTYVGTVSITFDSAKDRFDVPVVMTITSSQQLLSLSQTGLTFRAVSGGAAPPTQSFSVLNGGSQPLNWTATTSTLSGGAAWLSATPANGSSSSFSSPAIQVQVKPAGLAPGDYYGQVKISADGVANSPQSISVVLTVLTANAPVAPLVLPTGLIFVGQAGGANPAAQNVVITNLKSAPSSVSVATTAAFDQGSNWFTPSPKSGSATSAQPLTIAVQPSLTGLAAGVYSGELDLVFTDGTTPRRVLVLLIVVPRATSAIKTDAFTSRDAVGCTPSKLIPVFTQLGQSFTTAAAWPTSLEVRVVDDCGTPMTTGSVVASFSSGDPVVALTNLRDGRWSGTWQPRVVSSSPVTITAKALQAAPILTGAASIGGGLTPNPTTPVISAGGAVSAVSYAPLVPVAPGSLIVISGSALADGSTLATDLPLQTEIKGTQALLAGRALPLQYTSDGQINAIVPFDVPANATHQLIVRRATAYSVPESVIVATAEPAVYTADGSGKGAALIAATNPDGTQFSVDTDHPVAEGDTIVISCAGLGPVDPPVDAGVAAPDPPAQVVNPVTVTIGGQSATVSSAVLKPGSVGIYQVTATVPSGITPAPDAPLVVRVADQSSPAVTIAVKSLN